MGTPTPLSQPYRTSLEAASRFLRFALACAAALPAPAAGTAPYPRSPVIAGITFAPESEIIRKAPGSDNWPLTWADDDDLYTAYGDGWGFAPLLKDKLSLGLARIAGAPPDFSGINLRADTVERTGDGKQGPKASGMLMVSGVLYMWIRNVGNCQLAWSEDHGRTWQWGFKLEDGFGAPAFLNFGKDYSGARDEFVYTYSQDGPSAYETYDGVALARVPKSKIRQRDAYEFFVRTGQRGSAEWTRDIARRGSVFSAPGRCQRVDAVWHPGLRRYLIAVAHNREGSWGIYDAPEPWGPWTTVFYAGNWGLTGTHGYRLPAKWMAADGGSMYLVFSGTGNNDAFCVRGMVLNRARGDGPAAR